MSALIKVRGSGFSVSLDGDDLIIEPFSRLLPSQLDFLKSHKSQIIDELLAEQIPHPERESGLKPEHRQSLLDYMAHIGEEDQSMIDEYLSECERDPLVLANQLEWIKTQMEPNRDLDKLVKHGDCLHWDPIHSHGRGASHGGAGVMPMGCYHWSETLKQCGQWRLKSE